MESPIRKRYKNTLRAAAFASLFPREAPAQEDYFSENPPTKQEQTINEKVEMCARSAVTLSDGRIQIHCPSYGDPTASAYRYASDRHRSDIDPESITVEADPQHPGLNIITFRFTTSFDTTPIEAFTARDSGGIVSA
jgi:hypothetical protein